jgi:peroxiredoxin
LRQLRLAALPAPKSTVTEDEPEAPARKVGKPAPELVAQTLSGERATLASLRGRVVLLNLWATWCDPCRTELRELKKIHARYGAQGLAIVAVSVDRERTREQIRAFAKRRALPFTIWHDSADTASSAFGVGTLPASFLIDEDGRVAWAHGGAITAEDEKLSKAIAGALSEAR